MNVASFAVSFQFDFLVLAFIYFLFILQSLFDVLFKVSEETADLIFVFKGYSS